MRVRENKREGPKGCTLARGLTCGDFHSFQDSLQPCLRSCPKYCLVPDSYSTDPYLLTFPFLPKCHRPPLEPYSNRNQKYRCKERGLSFIVLFLQIRAPRGHVTLRMSQSQEMGTKTQMSHIQVSNRHAWIPINYVTCRESRETQKETVA